MAVAAEKIGLTRQEVPAKQKTANDSPGQPVHLRKMPRRRRPAMSDVQTSGHREQCLL